MSEKYKIKNVSTLEIAELSHKSARSFCDFFLFQKFRSSSPKINCCDEHSLEVIISSFDLSNTKARTYAYLFTVAVKFINAFLRYTVVLFGFSRIKRQSCWLNNCFLCGCLGLSKWTFAKVSWIKLAIAACLGYRDWLAYYSILGIQHDFFVHT